MATTTSSSTKAQVTDANWNDQMSLIDNEADFPERSCVLVWREPPRPDTWQCYWKDFDENEKDKPVHVFQHVLAHTKCGIVRPCTMDLDAPCPELVQSLLNITTRYSCFDRLIGWGDESDNAWEPIVIPWDNTVELTPQSLLAHLGAHDKIQSTAQTCDFASNNDMSMSAALRAIQAFLQGHSVTSVFYAGADQLNPVPCFAVSQVMDNVVAGFVGGVIYT